VPGAGDLSGGKQKGQRMPLPFVNLIRAPLP